MQLQRAFPGVEDPAEMMTEMPGQVLDRDLRHQVQVELGPQPGQPARQDLRALVRRALGQILGNMAVDEVRQTGQIVGSSRGEAAADHAGLQVRVQARGDDGFLAAAHDDQLIDELIVWPAPAADFLAQGVLLRRGQRLDDEHLEVRAHGNGLLGNHILEFGLPGVAVHYRPSAAGAVGLCYQRSVDPGHHPGKPVVAGRREQVPGAPVGLLARECPVLLDRGEGIEQPRRRLDHAVGRLTAQDRFRQSPARLFQPGPRIRAELPPAGVCPRAGGTGHAVAPASRRRRVQDFADRSARGRRDRQPVAEPDDYLWLLDPGPGIAAQPCIGRFQWLGERGGRDPPGGGGQQHPLQGLPGPQPVCRDAQARGKHGQLRGGLEQGVSDRLLPGGGEVADRCRAGRGARPKCTVGYAVTVALTAYPAREFGPVGGVGELLALGVHGQVQHAHGLVVVKDLQDRVFAAGRVSQFGQDAWRHQLAAERAAVSVPVRDGGIQLALRIIRAVGPGEPDGSQQQRLVQIREELDDRLAAGHGGGQPEVEQRGAAADIHPAATRIRA